VGKYLSHCIDSVLNQSFVQFEIILINDGSLDNSGKICDEYALKYNHIKVIHKQNEGVSEARNTGVSIANGEFIWFLDSDDFMTDNAMQTVANLIKRNSDVDMITCAHINNYADGSLEFVQLPFKSEIACIDREQFLYNLYRSGGAYWAPWKNIYRASIIKNNSLKFPKGVVCAEDCEFFMNFISFGEKFTFCYDPVVHYRTDREGSVTNVMSKRAILDRISIYIKQYQKFNQANNGNLNMRYFFANKFANGIYDFHYLSNEDDIIESNAYVKTYKKILKDSKGFKYYISKFFWKHFGYYKGSKILKKINLYLRKRDKKVKINESKKC
jgi:glycosyltransferase involved in cell wall biosynthesis